MKKFIIILSAATAAAVAVTILVTAILVSIKKPDKPPVSSDSQNYTSTYTPPQYDVSDNKVWSDPSSETSDESSDQSAPPISIPINTLTPAPKLEYSKGGKKVASGVTFDNFYNENSITVIRNNVPNVDVYAEQIEGLKDKKIQKKINQEIVDTLNDFVDEITEKYGSIEYARASIYEGFSNVISVTFKVGDGENTHYRARNYNLCDGLFVSLDDVFVDGAEYSTVIYEAFLFNFIYDSAENYDSDYDGNGNIETNRNEVYKAYKLTQNYLSQETKDFAFMEGRIVFYYDTARVVHDMREFANRLAIYDRFTTEKSIFEDDSIGKKNQIPCCPPPRYSEYVESYGYLEDNLWYDIAVDSWYGEDTFSEKLHDDMKKNLEEYRALAKKNPDKAYVVMQKAIADNENIANNSDTGEDYYQDFMDKVDSSCQMLCIENTVVFEMPKSFFEKEFKAIMFDAYTKGYIRVMTAGIHNGKFGIVIEDPEIKQVSYNEKAFITIRDYATCEILEKTQIDIEKHTIIVGGM